jgi:hypothetical protein
MQRHRQHREQDNKKRNKQKSTDTTQKTIIRIEIITTLYNMLNINVTSIYKILKFYFS